MLAEGDAAMSGGSRQTMYLAVDLNDCWISERALPWPVESRRTDEHICGIAARCHEVSILMTFIGPVG